MRRSLLHAMVEVWYTRLYTRLFVGPLFKTRLEPFARGTLHLTDKKNASGAICFGAAW